MPTAFHAATTFPWPRGVARAAPAALLLVFTLSCGGRDATSPDPDPDPTPAPVASISIAGVPTGPALIGQAVQLAATPKDAEGTPLTDRQITWRTANELVAHVSDAGLVSPVGPGLVTITAESEGKEATAQFDVRYGGSVGAQGGAVSFVGGRITIEVPEGAYPVATMLTVTPARSAPGDPRLVEGSAFDVGPLAPAPAQPLVIRMAYDPAITSEASLQLYRYVVTLWMPVHGSEVLTDQRQVRAAIGLLGTFALMVAPVERVEIGGAPESGIVFVGHPLQLSVIAYDAANNVMIGRPTTWTSSNTSAATVSASGRVTPLTVGPVTITVSVGGKEASVALDVQPVPVASVTVTGPAISSLYAGQEIQLSAVTRDGFGTVLTGRTVTWSSSHPERASVDETGLVTGGSAGAVIITATSEGQTGTFGASVLVAPLADWSSATDWVTYQGNAAHTGHVPVVADPRVFTERWVTSVASGPLNPVTAADGHVLVSTEAYFGSQILRVLDLATGGVRWSYDFGGIHAVHPPAYGGGRVYVTTSGHGDSFLWAFDASTGVVAFRSAYGNQWSRYYAPVVLDGIVYMAGGYYGGMYSFDGTDGTERWFFDTNQYDQWTPAVRDGLVYAYTGSYSPKLSVVDAATGVEQYAIADPSFDWNGWSMNIAPVLGGANNVLATQGGRLMSFDLGGRAIGWSRAGQFRGNVTVAEGTLYTVNGNQIEARAESDGALLWPWIPPQGHQLIGTLIATDNLLFVSSATTTWAIDIASRGAVWAYPAGGHLALSRDGTLLIAQANGKVAAIDVK